MVSAAVRDSFTFGKTALHAKCNVLQVRMLRADSGNELGFRDIRPKSNKRFAKYAMRANSGKFGGLTATGL